MSAETGRASLLPHQTTPDTAVVQTSRVAIIYKRGKNGAVQHYYSPEPIVAFTNEELGYFERMAIAAMDEAAKKEVPH